MNKPTAVERAEGNNIEAVTFWMEFAPKLAIMSLSKIKKSISQFFDLLALNESNIKDIATDLGKAGVTLSPNFLSFSSKEVIDFLTTKDSFYQKKLEILKEFLAVQYPYVISPGQREMMFEYLQEEM